MVIWGLGIFATCLHKQLYRYGLPFPVGPLSRTNPSSLYVITPLSLPFRHPNSLPTRVLVRFGETGTCDTGRCADLFKLASPAICADKVFSCSKRQKEVHSQKCFLICQDNVFSIKLQNNFFLTERFFSWHKIFFLAFKKNNLFQEKNNCCEEKNVFLIFFYNVKKKKMAS